MIAAARVAEKIRDAAAAATTRQSLLELGMAWHGILADELVTNVCYCVQGR